MFHLNCTSWVWPKMDGQSDLQEQQVHLLYVWYEDQRRWRITYRGKIIIFQSIRQGPQAELFILLFHKSMASDWFGWTEFSVLGMHLVIVLNKEITTPSSRGIEEGQTAINKEVDFRPSPPVCCLSAGGGIWINSLKSSPLVFIFPACCCTCRASGLRAEIGIISTNH